MLPQLLGEDSGPNQAVPTTLEFVCETVLADEVLRLELVAHPGAEKRGGWAEGPDDKAQGMARGSRRADWFSFRRMV